MVRRCHDERVSETDGGAARPAAEPGGRSARKWSARAELAERAVRGRHLRRLWALPGTLLGVCGAPPTAAQRAFGPWNYWWQAHVLDCLVDAYIRAPERRRRARVAMFVNSIRLRNGSGWLNDYYDDMAWLALALQRAERSVGVRRRGAVGSLADALRSGWTDDSGGGIWWRLKDKYDEDFKNTPTNGPAAILFARVRDPRGYDAGGWIERHLVDPQTGLVWDGVHLSADGGIREIDTARYTYCQGVYLGACLELAVWAEDGEPETWAERAARTVEAVAEHLTVAVLSDHAARYEVGPASGAPGDGAPPAAARDLPVARVLRGQGGGDGGLFAGILARYLARAALILPEFGPGFARTADLAADLVFDSAQAAWARQAVGPGGPVFGPEWSAQAVWPGGHGSPERDLSVQTGAWMLLEAAALLARSL